MDGNKDIGVDEENRSEVAMEEVTDPARPRGGSRTPSVLPVAPVARAATPIHYAPVPVACAAVACTPATIADPAPALRRATRPTTCSSTIATTTSFTSTSMPTPTTVIPTPVTLCSPNADAAAGQITEQLDSQFLD
jgi:hypothetical protein